ncbi:MAG TPA: winged helix-turn-helix transcriptional regulator [Gammaproteobacteria bacterium]|nr:winged helix-turn-helix transcriptional regulator [Gammaproteobacteria bacterium]
MNTPSREDAVTRGILETIDTRSDVSQRHLADNLGVALGLANLYLKRCVRKGLVKIKQAPANRYLYYLTPKGFAEKSRLTAQYLSVSFDFYRRAGDSCAKVFHICDQEKFNRLLLCGVSEFAEIASLRAEEHGIQIIGTFDPSSNRSRFVARPVWRRFEQVPDFDACVLTAVNDPAALYKEASSRIEDQRILVPDILGLKFTRNNSR